MIHRSNIFRVTFVLTLIILIFTKYSNIISGDGVGYYAYVRSLVFDHDLNFFNEFTLLNHNNGAFPDSSKILLNGLTPNPWSIGLSIIWSPFIIIIYLVYQLFSISSTGFELPYQFVVYISGILACAAVININSKITGLKSSQIWLFLASTPLAYYALWGTSMSHIYSALSISLIILFSLKPKINYTFLGFLIGFASLIRWQNSLFLLFGILIFLDKEGLKLRLRKLLTLFTVFIITFSPQLIIWEIIYGNWLVIPQGNSFFRLDFSNITKVVFDSNHGLLTQPVELIGLFGYIVLTIKSSKKPFYILLLLIFVLQLGTNSFLNDWFGGYSFGNRRMSDFLPIYLLGFSYFTQKVNQKLIDLVLTVLTVINLFVLKNFAGFGWSVFLGIFILNIFVFSPIFFRSTDNYPKPKKLINE